MITGPIFLQLDAAVFRVCHSIKTKPMQQNAIGAGLFTWRPKNTHIFTLIKTTTDTVIYCHDNDTAYFANPCAKLGGGFPTGGAVLAHWCIDENKQDGTKTPHLLAFDIIDQGATDPTSRGERLRLLSSTLPHPLCVLQWAGDLHALQQFIPTLPHEVECTVLLTSDPLVMHTQQQKNNAVQAQALSTILSELDQLEN